MSNSTLDTNKGKRLANHNRNGSWVISQSEKEEYSQTAQQPKDLKYKKRKPITTPTRFYTEEPLLAAAFSDKNCHYRPRNRLSHNGSFSERMNMSETGSFGKLRQSYGVGKDKRGHLKSSFQGTLQSDPIEDSDKKKHHNADDKDIPYISSVERIGNSKRRFHPIDRSVDFKVDIDKVGQTSHRLRRSIRLP